VAFQVDSYEKYVLECEEKEKAEMLDQIDDEKKSLEMSEKWKERRECLDMLKRELQRVRDGKDMSDWDSLLDEELKKHADLDSDKILEEEDEEDEETKKEKKKISSSVSEDEDKEKEKEKDSKKDGKSAKAATEPKKEK